MPRDWTLLPPPFSPRHSLPPCTCSWPKRPELLPKSSFASCTTHSKIVLRKPFPNEFKEISTPNPLGYNYTEDLENCYIYEHRTNQEGLQQSANAGCQFCAFLYGGIFGSQLWGEKIPSFVRKHELQSIILAMWKDSRDHWQCESDRTSLLLYVNWFFVGQLPFFGGIYPESLRELNCEERDYFNVKHDNVTVYPVRKPIGGFHENLLDPLELEYPDKLQLKSTGSFLNLKIARLWMNECLGSHQQCTAAATPHSNHPPLPNRILEVEESGRLVLRESKGQHASYMTLSYCWGNATRYLTTKDNIPELLQAVPTEDLPLTFQHAVTVCRFLGCRYLWIDALCIIQDSPEDVEKELASMGDIYRNSILTITAAGGFNANSGLFAARDPRWNRPCEISGFINEESQAFEFGGYITHGDNFSSYDPSEPLYARAWMSWRCMSYAGNETIPVLKPEASSHRQIRWALPDPHSLEMSNRDIFSCWYWGVNEYNSRSLTYLADKFRAIGALAAKFQELYGATYLAGIWKEDIQCGLSWFWSAPWYRKPDLSQTPCSDLSLVGGEQVPGEMEYVAPSWSWASIHISGIRFTHRGSGPRSHLGVQLLHYDIRRPSNALNAFGRVTYGALKLRGRARSGKLCPVDEEQDNEDRALGYLSEAKWGANCVDAENPEEWVGKVILDNMSIHELVQTQGFVEVLCLLVVACFTGGAGAYTWSLSAVVVVPMDEKAEIFRRVGLLQCMAGEDGMSWFGHLNSEDDAEKISNNDCIWTRTLTIL